MTHPDPNNTAQRYPCVEISLDNLLHNLTEIRSGLPPGVGVIAVVKDCAYGCGSVEVSRTLEQRGGVDFFAVARPNEAFHLRAAGIGGSILVLGKVSPDELREGVAQQVLFTLNDLADFDLWNSMGLDVRFHCNIDTGMNRMGLLPREVDQLASLLRNCPGMVMEGAFTHLACADQPGTATVDAQRALFSEALGRLRRNGITPRHVHYGNSAGSMHFPVSGCTMIRPGIVLYGCSPDPAHEIPLRLKPVASLKGLVVRVKQVPAGTPVSYGGRYVTGHDTTIVTVGIGYAHGVPRSLTNKGSVLIGGRRFPIAGTVTMDFVMADVGNAPVKVGDEAVVIGTQGSEQITPDDVARSCGTIAYEILCNLGTSVDRYYQLDGSTVLHQKGNVF